ncbi:MAG: Hsp33 family molecular chaperone HslO [Oscillospiraceae bacterium]|nr:Hsp33 family molecular chaperone HslO [Oscillospiraceae bacterium]
MDKIIRALAGDGNIKMSVITAKDTVERARQIHSLSPTASAALGRTLCAASLMGEMMKEDDGSLTIRVNGGGPIGSVVAVSDSSGNVRGYVENPGLELPLRTDGKLDVGGAVGREGMLTVSRDIGLREPYIGSTELVSGEIAEDLSSYLLSSEQIPSACGLGVLVDTDRSIKAAGGFIVQLLPFAPEELIEKLEDNIFFMDQLTTILAEDGIEEVFRQVLKGLDYQILSENEMEYRCYCSRERVEEAVSCIEKAELEDMAAEGREISVSCQFCDAEYVFTPDELRAIAEAKQD